MEMLGVVLWSDPKSKTAVFWCDDHGDLAYFTAQAGDPEYYEAFCAGDMVSFELVFERNMRRACNPSLVQQSVCEGLDGHLRDAARNAPRAGADDGQTVVPFRARDGAERLLPKRSAQNR